MSGRETHVWDSFECCHYTLSRFFLQSLVETRLAVFLESTTPLTTMSTYVSLTLK